MSVQQSNIYKIIVTDKKQAESVVYSGGFCGYRKDRKHVRRIKKTGLRGKHGIAAQRVDHLYMGQCQRD